MVCEKWTQILKTFIWYWKVYFWHIPSLNVKFDEANIVDEGSNYLFHSFGYSDKEDNINNDAIHTERDCKPDQVRMYGLNRHPTSKTDSVTLTADPTVVQEETEPLSATQTHVEAGFNHKKSTKTIKRLSRNYQENIKRLSRD